MGGGGGISSFIHCAGYADFSAIKHFDYTQSLETFNINFFSCCEIIKTLLKKTNKAYLKNILLISSISAIRGYKGSSIYAATKAGLDSLSRTLCNELSDTIRVNSIQLGNILTTSNTHLHQNNLKPSPTRDGKCEDVASLIEFLLSESAGWINGQNIILDGGKSNIGY
ncbi:SDR family oxidoreductase [Helicobacter sp. 13S00477-4]|uniref:SDR family oxidoreductase n=1 Tax=Helicobacter sp. 13S00477-4 TaxID=1905759 RepID=UPI000BA54F0B|nr:SDR family oxidoreductase [Helicobacter sp. 13S00477-4]